MEEKYTTLKQILDGTRTIEEIKNGNLNAAPFFVHNTPEQGLGEYLKEQQFGRGD
jgi:hypothetical protein